MLSIISNQKFYIPDFKQLPSRPFSFDDAGVREAFDYGIRAGKLTVGNASWHQHVTLGSPSPSALGSSPMLTESSNKSRPALSVILPAISC